MKRPHLTPLSRTVHPGAWWLWALALAVAASRTTNPLLLAMLLGVAGLVVARRRGTAPWALAFRMYLWLGAFIVVMRVLFRVIFGGGEGEHVLFTLPAVPLPEWSAGIRLLGPVAAEELLGGLYDGLRLAAMVVCVGAANALANPKRMLKALPGALHEVGTSVVVTLTVAPQLAESVVRVRRARRLRGRRTRGLRALHGIAVPVLEDAMNRSLALAAAMAAHGFGRTGQLPVRTRVLTGALVIGGLLGVCAGLYGAMGSGGPAGLGTPVLLAGLLLAVAGFLLGGRRVVRSTYRPDRWRAAELLVTACGLAAAALMYAAAGSQAAVLHPTTSPLMWPEVTPLPAVAVLLASLPAWAAPAPPRPTVQEAPA
ncbi:CbiQ family ECF transporter T component [Streptomyces sp. WMMB303]|uniref:CbiQ family ECF transporter T component n=1 Tax=Streptomyces sp. WMMB303 TaxID=3034154 RepID=UPI0023EAAF81|nr:CbiQ family ECF transporter T component [Streptomyces sp. WMMB303]MDF4251882.1 CbiQ family ECF transporter T component [Streptomyces sp. WMMB303]